MNSINLIYDLNGMIEQVVGNRGNVEISPRFLMAEEASIVGCALFRSTPVCNLFILKEISEFLYLLEI